MLERTETFAWIGANHHLESHNVTDNMIMGSSIIERISNESLPDNIQVNAYPGSTSSETHSVENRQSQAALMFFWL